jgi:hypothetical protein
VSEAAEIIINTIDGVDPFVRQQFSNMREKSRKLMAEKLMAEKKNLLRPGSIRERLVGLGSGFG